MIDLSTLASVPKTVRPIDEQGTFESRKLWEQVTGQSHVSLLFTPYHVMSNRAPADALLSKNYGEATKQKQIIEQAQRDRAEERKAKGEECVNWSEFCLDVELIIAPQIRSRVFQP